MTLYTGRTQIANPPVADAKANDASLKDTDEDANPLVLSDKAKAEFAAAVRASEAAWRAQLDGELDDVAGRTPAEPPAEPSRLDPPPSKATKKRPGGPGGSFFQATLGIQGVGKAKRAGMKCLHCGDSVAKDTWRFEFSYNTRRPCRSIHPTCLVQMKPDELQPSISRLRDLIRESGSEEERQICAEALDSLQGLQILPR